MNQAILPNADLAGATNPPPSPAIAKQLAIVRRRLLAERMVVVFPWIATITFAVAAATIAVDKYYPLGIAWPVVLWTAAGTTLLVTLVAASLTNRSELAAALELDRRCKLDERVSSALALRAVAASSGRALNPSEVAVRRAVEVDAEQAVSRVDVQGSFPIVASRKLAWPLVPMAAAIGLAIWLAPAVPPVVPVVAATTPLQVQMKESAKTLEKKLEEKRTEAEKLKLVEAQQLLEKLQEEARKLKAAEQIDRKETLVKLNDLAKQVQERRQEVSKPDEMKKQLSRLRAKNPGTSEKLTQALSEGNFREAAEQIEQLRKELESGKLDPKLKQQMGEQLQRLQKQVEQLAKAQEERRKEAEKQLADKKNQPGGSKDGQDKDGKNGGDKKSGDGEQASSKSGSQPGAMDESALAEQLSKMASQQQSLESLQKALDQASQGMQQGEGSEASKALNDLQQQLDQLSKQASEGELLDRGLEDLAEYKSSLSENQAGNQQAGNGQAQPGQNGGTGQPSQGQQGGGQNGQGRVGQGNGNGGGQGNQPGGTGIGQGVGTRFDGESPGLTGTFDTRVKQQIGSGALRVVGPTDGPNAKGKALEAIRDQEQAVAAGREAQTLESQALDRSRREQKKQYFDALRKAD